MFKLWEKKLENKHEMSTTKKNMQFKIWQYYVSASDWYFPWCVRKETIHDSKLFGSDSKIEVNLA